MIFEIFELTITIADLSLILILLISGVLAFFRGFITEILAIASWVGATISTLSFFKPLQPLVREIIPISIAADVVTGIVIFLISLLLISLLTHSIANLIRGKSDIDFTLYASHSTWETEQDFLNWTKSDSFKLAHKNAGQNSNMYLGHPIFEGFNIVI